MIATDVGYALSVITLATIWLVGIERTRHLAYVIGFFSQLVWAFYVVELVYQPALLLLELPLLVIYGRHIVKGD